jgi:hypothetical protein
VLPLVDEPEDVRRNRHEQRRREQRQWAAGQAALRGLRLPDDRPDDEFDQDRNRIGTNRYASLPEQTRRLLEGLGDKDVDAIKELTEFVRQKGMPAIKRGVEMAETVDRANRLVKWFMGAAVAVAGFAGLLAGLYTFLQSMRNSSGRH